MDIDHIVKLARIKLDKNEKNRLEKDLSAVLDFFEKLKRVDTKKIEPIAHITGLINIVRQDKKIKISEKQRQKLLKSAPKRKDDYVKVKSVL